MRSPSHMERPQGGMTVSSPTWAPRQHLVSAANHMSEPSWTFSTENHTALTNFWWQLLERCPVSSTELSPINSQNNTLCCKPLCLAAGLIHSSRYPEHAWCSFTEGSVPITLNSHEWYCSSLLLKAWGPPGNLLQMQNFSPISNLLSQSLHFNKKPWWVECTLKFKKHCRRKYCLYPAQLPLGSLLELFCLYMQTARSVWEFMSPGVAHTMTN